MNFHQNSFKRHKLKNVIVILRITKKQEEIFHMKKKKDQNEILSEKSYHREGVQSNHSNV